MYYCNIWANEEMKTILGSSLVFWYYLQVALLHHCLQDETPRRLWVLDEREQGPW